MPVKTRSLRQEQLELSTRLREEGRTWVEIAELFAGRYGLNPRNALRLAHGWSQREAADLWNERWPDDPKTFKNFSYWEMWPSATGYTPSLEVLTKLAELYECSVADLLVDCPDYRRLDHANQANRSLESIGAIVEGTVVDGNGHPPSAAGNLSDLVDRVEAIGVHELASASSRWAQSIEPDTTRRTLLLKLSSALALAATMPSTAWATVDAAESLDGAGPELAGIWRSTYTFFSSRRSRDIQSEHFVVLRHSNGRLLGQSLPHTTGSRLSLDLAVEKPVVTGTWLERTSPVGYYAGATYHGTLQMFIDPLGRTMKGKWLGFGKNFEINSGDWQLTWVESSTSKQAQRKYDMKA
jgi:hypothetical protein